VSFFSFLFVFGRLIVGVGVFLVGMDSYCEFCPPFFLVVLGRVEKFWGNFFRFRFDTVEAAEKCIDALRHYRNLHPSFSKVRGNDE
jgi:hypothetical protein